MTREHAYFFLNHQDCAAVCPPSSSVFSELASVAALSDYKQIHQMIVTHSLIHGADTDHTQTPRKHSCRNEDEKTEMAWCVRVMNTYQSDCNGWGEDAMKNIRRENITDNLNKNVILNQLARACVVSWHPLFGMLYLPVFKISITVSVWSSFVIN